ncbi:targeting protein for Xklp2-A-like isoform X2 [Polypterus senegalus]|uniref:targeting protein for Xklp2-A-like isoform X2 n=1 Tax=Polypterus senegalus TaxID=55291 RepID=UPI001965D19B|nr:targeting protein for Xklp2-A-like isoform X2 [Polypterus senegalus]XP_039626896.1 targeting protein for Xklp2-A-like isoform X2 [Polypterus senegalus]
MGKFEYWKQFYSSNKRFLIPVQRNISSSEVKSTEEQELEKMQQLQKKGAELQKKNDKSLKAALAGTGVPYKPVDFHFYPDARIKQNETQSKTAYKVDFTAELHKHPPLPARIGKSCTVPKPFNLSCSNKRRLEDHEFVAMAQQIKAFQNRTSMQFHVKSKNKNEGGPSPVRTTKLMMTNPKIPNLLAVRCNRPVTCKSTAEANTLEKIKQFKCKARGQKILEGGLLPKKPAPKPTQHEKPALVKANPVPRFGVPFKPKPLENKQVEVCPFSFKSREKENKTLKEKHLEELHKDELKEEQKQQVEPVIFKAHPNTVTHQETSIPKEESRVLEASRGFELLTENRSKEQMEFLRALSEKEAVCARNAQDWRREQEEREKEEIARLHQEQVHKAEPIPKFKKVDMKHSTQASTVPISPKFYKGFRI